MVTTFLQLDRYGRRQPSAAAWSRPIAVAFAVLLGLSLAGCQTAQRCEPLHKCGGNLLAGGTPNIEGKLETEWVATNPDSCMDQIQLPLNPVSLAQQPARPAGKKAVSPATFDWCMNLLQSGTGTVKFTPFFPIIPVRDAVLKITEGGEYLAHFTNYQPQQMQFSKACRDAQGINQSCPQLGRKLKESIAAESNVTNMRCYDDDEGGCLCDYELLLLTSLPGSWGADGGVVTFYDESKAPSPPAPTDYCVNGDSLELTGHNGGQLFNRQGLRTLVMHPRSCSDGVQNGGENDVDCGEVCGNTCPTCDNGMQDGRETGKDCGGACPDLCECYNGVKDPFEDGVDCGGPCALLCSCTNGVQDGAETGVDCGGECFISSVGMGVEKKCTP